MKKDNFWKIFWSVVGTFMFLIIISIGWLKFSYLNQPEDLSLALAVGANFDPSKDPFENTRKSEQVKLVNGYLYQDSIPYGFQDWSWDSIINWRMYGDSPDNSYSAEINFTKPWAGIRLSSDDISVSDYSTITLEIKPYTKIEDFYIELYDKYGNSMGKQSLSWYMDSKEIKQNEWNKISIPLKNLSTQNNITGFSITSKNAGIVILDSVRFEKEKITHEKWIDKEPEPSVWIGKDPFTNSPQFKLPYNEIFSDETITFWKNLFGKFEKRDNTIIIGPIPKETTGSMVIFGGGKDWKNYRVDVTVYWGITSTFSILGRFQDDGNFVSCNYSNYGSVVQIYLVKDGESTLISQTPTLAIRSYEPWSNAKHALSVKGKTVSCFMDDEMVLRADLPQIPEIGSIGFETWSKNSNDYPHKVSRIIVKPITE